MALTAALVVLYLLHVSRAPAPEAATGQA
jgi:hypothetical protein